MTDFIDPDEGGDEGQQQGETPQMAEVRKQLKAAQKQAKEYAEAAARAEKAERRLAFAEAGINLSDKRAALFIKGYDGELEPEKVKAAWTEYFGEAKPESKGDEGAPQQPEPQQIPPYEYNAFGQMQQAVGGSPIPEGREETIRKGMIDVFEKGGEPADVARFLASQGYPVAPGYE